MEKIKTIIEGCIREESKYQRIFYDRFRGFACKLVFRYIYRYEDAMDVVTDGFIKAFKNFAQFKLVPENEIEKLVMGWLKKIMVNSAIDELRKNNFLPQIGSLDDKTWDITDKYDDADRLVLYRDLIMQVKQLPPVQRTVFNLVVIDGYSHSEAAEKLEIAVGTSKSHLSRAKFFLQKQIKQMEDGILCRI